MLTGHHYASLQKPKTFTDNQYLFLLIVEEVFKGIWSLSYTSAFLNFKSFLKPSISFISEADKLSLSDSVTVHYVTVVKF